MMYKKIFYIANICWAIWFCVGCSNPEQNANQNPPNVVLIISDDHAWTDYSFMEHPHIETPYIDNLASEGLTFTRGYVAAPVCRPSLASIITGLYPHQHGVTGNDPKGVGAWGKDRAKVNEKIIRNFRNHPSLPDLLSKEKYVSFQTGKWWEGSWRNGGFTDGMTHGDPEQGGRHGDEGLKIGREGMQLIFNFIDKAQSENSPFFLWYAPFLPHTPHTPPDSLLQKYLPKAPNQAVAKYWAMVEWFDSTVGQLLGFLDQKELSENTLVVYVSDNGWIQNPDPDASKPYMPGSKLSPYDMGIRTPIIYNWPGHITPKMDTTNFVCSTDIAPTVLESVGLEPTSEMQGINVLNKKKLSARSVIYSEDFTHDIYDIHDPSKSLEHRVVLDRPWKLILPYEKNIPGSNPELYHIINDPHEKQNIASEYPKIVNDLRKELDSWWNPEL